jgi:hypothetical protein
MAVKYVFVTGGVVSGLGKGITAASLGRLLKARGYHVTMQKFDSTVKYLLRMTERRQILISGIMKDSLMRVWTKCLT